MKRRHFLKVAADTAFGFHVVPRSVRGGPRFVPPSEKVKIAIVGAGGQGRVISQNLFREADAQLIALADPMESVSLEGFYYKGMGDRVGDSPRRSEATKLGKPK